MKRTEALIGTQAKSRRSKARTIVGYSIWIHLNWREAQTPIRKVVWAQTKEARRERGREVKVEEREEEKKKASWEKRRENQMAKKERDLCKLMESRM